MRKNHGKPYTQDQDAQIINLVKQGKSRKEIAEVMGRTEDSVNSRIRKLQDQGQIAY
jgi:DNA-binding CsgD family transcriptional regulator